MKKHSKTKVNKKSVLNKLGMTYVELLCALSLLSLIIVMFTPMLLSSYDTVYKAGERVEEAYDSKEEIEEKLSTRLEESIFTFGEFNLESNADDLLYKVEITGKKIVSGFTHGLETLFGVAKARVRIISPRVVYDDQSNHELIIQIKGLEYNKVTFGNFVGRDVFIENNKNHTLKNGIVHVEVTIPKKELGVEESDVYTSAGAAKIEIRKLVEKELKYVDVNKKGEEITHSQNGGRIFLKISSATDTELDFTQSPVRIKVHYVDNRDKYRSTCDYLTIEPPTMLFAGEADSSVDYYTSAGVVEKGGKYSLTLNKRKMRLDNSGALVDGTDNLSTGKNHDGQYGTTIQTVTWIDTDENANLNPYYVMAGTYSRVYRMYNCKPAKTLQNVFPKSNIPDAMDTKDNTVVLSDGTSATPSFWSGDISDQYYFKTMEHASGYGAGEYVNADCTSYMWEESKIGTAKYVTRRHYGSKYDAFDTRMRYVMLFSGFATGYDYQHLANRRISYVLTEVGGGKSFRLAGKLGNLDEFDGYSYPWEPGDPFAEDKSKNTFYFGKSNLVSFGFGKPRYIAGTGKNEPYEGPVYFQGSGAGIGVNNDHFDRNFAYLRIKSSVSVDPITATINKGTDPYKNYYPYFEQNGFWCYKSKDQELKDVEPMDYDKDNAAYNFNWLEKDVAKNVHIHSSVYLPNAGSDGEGQVIYFGSVPATVYIAQSSDIGSDEDAIYVYNNDRIKDSRSTAYVVRGGIENTIIYRAFSSDNNAAGASNMMKKLHLKSGKHEDNSYVLTDKYEETVDGITVEKFYVDNRDAFYNYSGDKIISYTDNDLRVTFGYCSRWRMAIGDVTSNGLTEEPRSYEKYYKASNKAASYFLNREKTLDEKNPTLNKQGGTNNLYYNVWFPGEYYNLTHVATCDELTVAVGYAVSGSSFMKGSAAWGDSVNDNHGFYGTALGSIYNDGVVAAYVSEESGGTVFGKNDDSLKDKGKRNTIFQNVLYYKTPDFLDDTLHSRKSVRFTAVGLYTVAPYLEVDNSGAATVADITEEKEYYVVYGDSRGKAFISKIATAEFKEKTDSSGGAVNEDSSTEERVEIIETVELCTGDTAIPATSIDSLASFKNGNGMFEIKVKGATLDTIYSEIKTICVENDIIVITGSQKTASTVEKIVVGTRTGDDSNEWNFEILDNGTFTDVVQSAKIIGGYYYICGNNSAGSNWVAAVSVDTLRDLAIGTDDNNTISNVTAGKTNESGSKNDLLWTSTDTKVLAFDGRDTRG